MAGPAPGLPPGLSAQYWSRLALAGPGTGVEALALGPGEAWIGGWDGVGLYQGNSKVGTHQALTLHVTTHRLLLVPDPPGAPAAAASAAAVPLQAPLSSVRQTEFYSGFMRSSPKITLYLGRGPVAASSSGAAAGAAAGSSSGGGPEGADADADAGRASPAEAGSWACGVCGFANALPAGTALGAGSRCALCGVAWAVGRSLTPAATPAATPGDSRAGTPSSATPATITTTTTAPAPATVPPPETGTGSGSGDGAPGDGTQVACPACTFLNHPSMSRCEICGTPLRRRTTAANGAGGGGGAAGAVDGDGAGAGAGAAEGGKHDVVRLSFRRGGAAEAHRRLKGVLSDRAWERAAAEPAAAAARDDNPGAGIDAIMRNITLSARAADGHVQSAFRDLEVMMVRAGEMVALAQGLDAKLQAAGGGTDAAEATLVRSSLVRMGLPAPALTSDMVRDERAYLDGLARELGVLLTGGAGKEQGLMLEAGHGVLALDTVWGVWMRVRGLALLPPATLTLLLDLLPRHTRPPVRKLELPSGLVVLHAPHYGPDAWRARLIHRLRHDPHDPHDAHADDSDAHENDGHDDSDSVIPGLSPLEVCAAEGVPLGLGEELTQLAAAQGGLARDDQARGGRWYADLIAEWPLGLL